MTQYQRNDRALGWDEEIVNDEAYTLLPEGEYPFRIISLERGRYDGSDKMPSCNVAILGIEVEDPSTGSKVKIIHRLYLHTGSEGQIGEFFVSIGQKRKGEPLKMNWNTVVGASGRCKLSIRAYNDNQYNRISKFLEPAALNAGGWVPGTF